MLVDTEPVQNRPLKFANKPVENPTLDPFTMVDGHYVGHDGFVVPKNFDEFSGSPNTSVTGSEGTWTGQRQKKMSRTGRKTC